MVENNIYSNGINHYEEVTGNKNLLLTDRFKVLNVTANCTITATAINYPVGSQFAIIVDPNIECIFANRRDGNSVVLSQGTNVLYIRRNGSFKVLTNDLLNGNSVNDRGYDVWLIGGQSNASGSNSNTVAGNGSDTLLDYTHPRVFQFGQYATEPQYLDRIIVGRTPLKHPDTASRNAASVGFGMSFATEAIKSLSPDRDILLVPRGFGGSGMLGGGQEWNPTNGSYLSAAIAASNKAIATNPKNIFRGLLWILGEADAGSNVTYENHLAALQLLISRIRNEVTNATESVVIIGSMVPDWVGSFPARLAIHRAMREIPHIVSKSWFVMGDYNKHDSASNQETSIIHYNSAGQRSMGAYMANAIPKAIKNKVGNVPPKKITNLTQVSNYASNYVLRWDDTGFSYSYEIWISVNGGAETLYETTLTNRVELFYTTLGSTTRVRVRGRNVNGVGEFSDPLTLTVPLVTTPRATPTKPFFLCNRDNYVLDGSGTFLNAMLDISGNNRHFLKQNANKPNPSSINGINAIAFGSVGAANLVGVMGSYPNNSSYTMYSLTYLTTLATAGVMFGTSALAAGGNALAFWRQTAGQGTYKGGHNTFTLLTSTLGVVINQWFSVWLVFNSTTNIATIYINNTAVGSGNFGASVAANILCYNTFNVSNNGNNHFCLEFGCYDRVLTAQEILNQNARLVDTYGITLGVPA